MFLKLTPEMIAIFTVNLNRLLWGLFNFILELFFCTQICQTTKQV